jgi:hypothetical protein
MHLKTSHNRSTNREDSCKRRCSNSNKSITWTRITEDYTSNSLAKKPLPTPTSFSGIKTFSISMDPDMKHIEPALYLGISSMRHGNSEWNVCFIIKDVWLGKAPTWNKKSFLSWLLRISWCACLDLIWQERNTQVAL